MSAIFSRPLVPRPPANSRVKNFQHLRKQNIKINRVFSASSQQNIFANKPTAQSMYLFLLLLILPYSTQSCDILEVNYLPNQTYYLYRNFDPTINHYRIQHWSTFYIPNVKPRLTYRSYTDYDIELNERQYYGIPEQIFNKPRQYYTKE